MTAVSVTVTADRDGVETAKFQRGTPLEAQMVRSLVRVLLTTTAIAGAISGCGDGTAPSGFAGLYRLDRYEGAVLPAINRLTSADTMYVVSEQLWLTNGGDGVHAGTWRLVNAATPQGAR